MATSSPATHESVVLRGVRPRSRAEQKYQRYQHEQHRSHHQRHHHVDRSQDGHGASERGQTEHRHREQGEHRRLARHLGLLATAAAERRHPQGSKRHVRRQPADHQLPRSQHGIVHRMQRHEELMGAAFGSKEQQGVQPRQVFQIRGSHQDVLAIQSGACGVAYQQVVCKHADAPQHHRHAEQKGEREGARFEQSSGANGRQRSQRKRHQRDHDVSAGDVEELVQLPRIQAQCQVIEQKRDGERHRDAHHDAQRARQVARQVQLDARKAHREERRGGALLQEEAEQHHC